MGIQTHFSKEFLGLVGKVKALWQSPKKFIKSHRLAPVKGPADSLYSPVCDGSVRRLAARIPIHVPWDFLWTSQTCPWASWRAKPALHFRPWSTCEPERQNPCESQESPSLLPLLTSMAPSGQLFLLFSPTEFWILLIPSYRNFLWLVHCSLHRTASCQNLLRGLYLQG